MCSNEDIDVPKLILPCWQISVIYHVDKSVWLICILQIFVNDNWSDVTWASWHLKSTATPLFVQIDIKYQTLIALPLCEENNLCPEDPPHNGSY